MPDLGTIQIYDYDKDVDESKVQADEVLESMVDLYLGDYPDLVKHKYVQQKMKEDAKVYADTLFLQKMTKRNFLTQLRQVDNGDNSARMHEVVNQSVSQIRDNIKFSQTQRTEFEKFWKDMRKDLGLNELSETMEQKNQAIVEEENKGNLMIWFEKSGKRVPLKTNLIHPGNEKVQYYLIAEIKNEKIDDLVNKLD